MGIQETEGTEKTFARISRDAGKRAENPVHYRTDIFAYWQKNRL